MEVQNSSNEVPAPFWSKGYPILDTLGRVRGIVSLYPHNPFPKTELLSLISPMEKVRIGK